MNAKELKEFDEDAYQKAFEKWAQVGPIGEDWYDHVYDWMKEQGKEKGFEVDDIEFTGFYSQGDGARWKGSIDVHKWLQGEKYLKTKPEWMIYGELVRVHEMEVAHVRWDSSRYCHENTMSVYIDWEDIGWDGLAEGEVPEGVFKGLKLDDAHKIIEPHAQTIEDTLLEAARDFAKEIYRALEKEYEYQTSEECFIEWAEANEIKFDEEGGWE